MTNHLGDLYSKEKRQLGDVQELGSKGMELSVYCRIHPQTMEVFKFSRQPSGKFSGRDIAQYKLLFATCFHSCLKNTCVRDPNYTDDGYAHDLRPDFVVIAKPLDLGGTKRRDFMNMELDMLRITKYDINYVTPLEFVVEDDLVTDMDLVPEKYHNNPPAYLCTVVRSHCASFAKLALRGMIRGGGDDNVDHNLYTTKPSLMAASLIYVSRKGMVLSPLWPTRLAIIFGMPVDKVSVLGEHLWKLYERAWPDQVKIWERDMSPLDIMSPVML